MDDDFIVYRYAQHVLEHGEYAFNLGSGPTDGVTTPGWWLLILPAVALGVSPEWWSPALGILCYGLLARVLVASVERAGGGRAASLTAGLVVAASPALAWHARAGLGTLVAALLVAAAAERGLAAFEEAQGGAPDPAARARARRKSGWALAAAVLVRPEAAAVCLGYASSRTLRRVGTLAPPLVALAALGIWRQLHFGQVLPHTAAVKALPLADELQYGWGYLLRSLREGGLALWLLIGSACFLRDACVRWVGMAAAAGVAVVLVTGGDWMVYGRTLVPFAPLGLIGAFAGARSWSPIAAGLLALGAYGWTARPQAVFENEFFEQHWLRAGDALAERAAPEATIALSPIGAIGWRSGLEIVDVLGLTHGAFVDVAPDLETIAVKGHHRHDGAWVLDQEPDYLLLGNARFQPDGRVEINPWEADVVGDGRFQRDYVTDAFELEPGGARVPYARRREAPRL